MFFGCFFIEISFGTPFSKQHQLLHLLRLVVNCRRSQQYLNITALLFCDYQHPHRTLCRDCCGGRSRTPPLYAQWEAWLREHYWALRQRVLTGESAITLGLNIYTAAEGEEALAPIAPVEQPVVAKFQSIGTAPAYRYRGVARRLVDLALEQARAAGADTAMCLAWVTKGRVPMGGILLASGFSYLRDAHRVWYDNENLVCPYCKGRCTCDAAIYYKILKERD